MNLLSNSVINKYIALPEATYNSLKVAEGSEWSTSANAFLEAIFNKLVYQKVNTFTFVNPFRKYYGAPIKYGVGIENIYVDKIMGRVFDRNQTDPFEKNENRVLATYAKLNYEMQYAVTVEDAELRKAVLSEYGEAQLANTLTGRLSGSSDIDEYLATIIMLNNPDNFAGGFETIDVSGEDTPSGVAHAVSKKIGEVYRDFKLPSIDNNKLHVMNASRPEDILIIIKSSLMNDLDYDYLAATYNLSKAEIKAATLEVRSFRAAINVIQNNQIVTISTEERGDDLDFMIIDTRGLDLHDALRSFAPIYNPRGMYTNTFHNVWACMQFNSAMQARAYKIQRTATTSESTGD